MIEVARFIVGPIQTNAYLVSAGDTSLLIDPGAPAPDVEAAAAAADAVVFTHGHYDHIEGAPFFRERGIPLWIGEKDADCLIDPEHNLSVLMGRSFALSAPADRILHAGDTVACGGLCFSVLHVPGHSPGSIALYGHGLLFSGDVLFYQSIGRSDLPGGDHELLLETITETLYTLPDETRVLPGHGPETTIGREKRSNPFVRG